MSGQPGARVWVQAARPRTLPAVVAPVVVGTASAEHFLPGRFALALLVGLALQVGVNFANDYFDGIRGVDTVDRVGPPRAVSSGWVSPPAMRRAMIAAFGLAAVAGLALALIVEPWLLIVGALALVAALGYSGGPRPYASAGLGEVFVFVFFGLVATVGSAYAQDHEVTAVALVAGALIGMWASALLVVNNLRDIATDAPAGKRTLAVRLGQARTQRLFSALIVLPFALIVAVAVLVGSAWPLLGLAGIGFAVAPIRTVTSRTDPASLIQALGDTGRLELVAGLLLAAGLWLA